MLKFEFKGVNGELIAPQNPVYIVINQDENIPADDLTVAFPLFDNNTELCEVTVYDENEVVFRGIVDEQQNIVSSSRRITKIAARSMAAMLLDNECMPVSYSYPSTSVIFDRHIKPNCIDSYIGEERVMEGNLKIPKGTTEWQAVTAFSLEAYGAVPRIEAEGTVNFYGVKSNSKLVFSNTDGIKYNSIKENNKRCKLISRVLAKAGSSSRYDTVIADKNAVKRNVRRERYLDSTAGASLRVADTMIENGEKSSYEITVNANERLINVLGAAVVFKDRELMKNEGLYVSGIYYQSTPGKEETILTVKGGTVNVDT